MSGGIRGGDDRISNLPNEIIGAILSMLPIKDVVRTSVLSPDWKLKWKLISDYDVEIDAREFFCKPSREKADIFINFVDRIIVHLQKIKSFHLNTSDSGEYVRRYLKSWVSAVLSRDIESLQIIMCTCIYEMSLFLCSFQSCVALKNLEVVTPCTFKVIDHNRLDNLVTLKLQRVTFVIELSNSNPVKFSFPVVREMVLEECIWSRMKVVEMHAPSLKIYKSMASYVTGENGYSMKIVGSRLEKLFTNSGPPENIILDDSTVDYAYMDSWNPNGVDLEEHGFKIRKLLRELSAVNSMVLDGFLDAIAQIKHGLPLQRFTKLEKLRVNYPIDVEGLLELLHATPYLKFLIIDFGDGRYNGYDYGADENVPYCLVSHLEKVMLDYFNSDELNFELAEFLLRNGVRLKSVSVRGSPYFPTNEIVNKLLTFPKVSSCLTIEDSPCSASQLL